MDEVAGPQLSLVKHFNLLSRRLHHHSYLDSWDQYIFHAGHVQTLQWTKPNDTKEGWVGWRFTVHSISVTHSKEHMLPHWRLISLKLPHKSLRREAIHMREHRTQVQLPAITVSIKAGWLRIYTSKQLLTIRIHNSWLIAFTVCAIESFLLVAVMLH